MDVKKNKIAAFHDNIIKHIVSFIKTYYGFFVFIILLLILWFLVISPAIEISNADLATEKKIIYRHNHIKTVAQLFGGIVLLAGIYFAWKRIQINGEGQITERFTRAIDQLGNKKNLEVRLGGIYALERIAKDSRKDHPQIMEILAAYIRENAKIDNSKSAFKNKKAKFKNEIVIKEDIQSILTVIGRRNWVNDKTGQLIDLSNTDLQRYIFKGWFKNLLLRNSQLQGADFRKAFLQNSDFYESSLQSAMFIGTNLQGASFYKANLQKANLRNTKLYKTDFSCANLQKAILWYADLQAAYFCDANLYSAFFKGANLQNAILEQANLECALLYEANLYKADLWRANLKEASLDRANLKDANLGWVNLQGVLGFKKIISLKNTNIYNVKNAPKNFIKFAKKNGAIEKDKF